MAMMLMPVFSVIECGASVKELTIDVSVSWIVVVIVLGLYSHLQVPCL